MKIYHTLKVVLNSLGFSTFSSCQGHPERNGYLPFVLCCNNYAEDLPLMSKICGSIKKTSKNIIDSLEDELTDTLQEQNRMSKYLSEFYIDRETPMKYRLILSTNIFCRFSIEPYMSSIINGSDIPESHKKEFNSICLKEIHDFTDFLKTKL